MFAPPDPGRGLEEDEPANTPHELDVRDAISQTQRRQDSRIQFLEFFPYLIPTAQAKAAKDATVVPNLEGRSPIAVSLDKAHSTLMNDRVDMINLPVHALLEQIEGPLVAKTLHRVPDLAYPGQATDP